MSLLESRRPTREDLEMWQTYAATDALYGSLRRMSEAERRAMDTIVDFVQADERPFYVSVSWGKDSVVVAHLAWRALGSSVRLAWFPAGPIENPDNYRVRDAFMSRFPCQYLEVEASGHVFPDPDGHDGAQEAFEVAAASVAPRYMSGVRAQESGLRKLRMRAHGLNSRNTSAPIGWWRTRDVFAYLARHDLPIHPAYACTMGGRYDREQIRVSTLGGWRGAHRGRVEWEQRYYGAELGDLRRSGKLRA